MPSLELSNLTFSFSVNEPLLDKVSLSVPVGESVVIAGANGSGKSTLLLLAAGILSPQSGFVAIRDDTNKTNLNDSIALVMQNPDHQMIADTVEEEIALALELRGSPRDFMLKRVEEMLTLFDLHELKSRSPEALSGGQKQRVALAAIFVSSPIFLLLDEPDAMLDAPGRKEFLQALDAIRNQCGMIWTCADPDRLPEANRFFWLERARLFEVSREEILTRSVASVE
jgi:energy-coupling factor transport system ATP-binding protein